MCAFYVGVGNTRVLTPMEQALLLPVPLSELPPQPLLLSLS